MLQMRTAIISDIHGNATAFKEVLKDIKNAAVDMTISLGDNIGYGPEPDEVIHLLNENHIPSVIGNHEMAINRPRLQSWFNPIARTSLEKTITLMSESSLRYIRNFNNCMVLNNLRFVHGFPPGSVTLYLFEMTEKQIIDVMTKMNEKICFIGHTHVQEIITFDGKTIFQKPLREGIIELDDENKYIINAGSVGQPRDGNAHAKYVIFDSLTNELTVRYIPYDVQDTIKKIYQVGLPEQHALRLMK